VLAGERGKGLCVICEVYGADGSPETLLANEALLAAAPTVLQALRELVNAVHGQEPATVARAMRGAASALAMIEGGNHA
jgi:hypothetical protein